jgi:hypothetical protein
VQTMALILGVLIASLAQASTVSYTESSPFLAALQGPPSTLDFESLPPGTLIASGSSVDGVTFTYDLGGEVLKVTAVLEPTSPSRSLGVAGEDGALLDRDALTFDVATPVTAFGLFVITSDPALAGEIQIKTQEGVVQNSATPEKLLNDGGIVYFIGLTSTIPFSTAALDFANDEIHFAYNADDIVTAVPEPDWLLGMVVGVIALRGSMRWRRPRKEG